MQVIVLGRDSGLVQRARSGASDRLSAGRPPPCPGTGRGRRENRRRKLMQVVILCGGQGTRIRDIADDIPKPMIPIGGRPILWHIMKRYARYGFTNFVLCLGYKSWVLKRFFLDY